MKIKGVNVKVGDHVALKTTADFYERATIIRLEERRLEVIIPYKDWHHEFDIELDVEAVDEIRVIQSGEDSVNEQTDGKFSLGQVILTRKCWYWNSAPFVGAIVAVIDGMVFVENVDGFQTCDAIDEWMSIDDWPWLKKKVQKLMADRA